jgi:glutamate/aspartate transport system substrate-binding protein
MRRLIWAARCASLAALALLLVLTSVSGQPASPAPVPNPPTTTPTSPAGAWDETGLSGTLAEITRTGVVRLGYREGLAPFSFLDRSGRPIGYSIDLCNAIVEEIGRALGRDDLKVEYQKVTSETRLSAVIEGKIDLECGSTTANLQRAKTVSFSPLIFVAGTKILVKKGTPWTDFRDLKGKTIAVTAGTTNIAAIKKLDEKFNLGVTLIEGPDHNQSYQMLVDGKVDGFATDDVLLAGLLAQHHSQDKFAIVGELLSYDPYGIVYRHDDKPMKDVIETAFRGLVVNNEVDPIYDRWFGRRLPNGEAFHVPMSPQLEAAWDAFHTGIGPEHE